MKKNYLLAIASYPDSRQDFFNTYTSKRNKEYCEYHKLEYIEITENVFPIRGKIGWFKTFKVNDIIQDLNNGDTLTYFDADMLIVKKEKSFCLTQISHLHIQLIVEILTVWDHSL